MAKEHEDEFLQDVSLAEEEEYENNSGSAFAGRGWGTV